MPHSNQLKKLTQAGINTEDLRHSKFNIHQLCNLAYCFENLKKIKVTFFEEYEIDNYLNLFDFISDCEEQLHIDNSEKREQLIFISNGLNILTTYFTR